MVRLLYGTGAGGNAKGESRFRAALHNVVRRFEYSAECIEALLRQNTNQNIANEGDDTLIPMAQNIIDTDHLCNTIVCLPIHVDDERPERLKEIIKLFKAVNPLHCAGGIAIRRR